jgi:hypothetical protein
MAKSNKNTRILWSEDEIKLLKKLYHKGKARQIADQTGRALSAVRQKAYDMGLKTREWRLWSADEIKLLFCKLNQNQTVQSIADILGRSLNAVSKKASSIGLRKGILHPWSIQEESLLKKLHPINTAKDIAKRIGRSVPAVVSKHAY